MAGEQFVVDSHVKLYSVFRKNNPEVFAEKTVSFLKEKFDGLLDTAADVGCGNGQGTVILAPFFKTVFGLDISETQIKEAKASRSAENITYLTSPSENLPFEDGSVQLVTAATCLHWFDLDRFFPEVRRVLCNNGVLAVYGYRAIKPLLEDCIQKEAVDQIYKNYFEELHSYFNPLALMIKNNYESVNFPFEEIIRVEKLPHTFEGCLSEVVGFANSWSALQNYREADKDKAEKCLSAFRDKMFAIGEANNVSPNDRITLYRDYSLILCRKIEGQDS